ncbi:amidohydrolase family protein [Azospirillum sp. ST 5-10]|uniref:amidohydrolase family protein n=1 Tax=unclassified Azospirillum TaxID=2630922 RepID=UPI003F4A3174
MAFDLLLRGARLDSAGGSGPGASGPGASGLVDIGIRGGRIAAVAPDLPGDGPVEELGGRLAMAGFVETHIHLDKSCIQERCACREGTLAEAIREVAAAKRAFTEEDVAARGARTLERAIVQGTTRMRTHVEVDPRVGLRAFRAVRGLKRAYAWAVDLQVCVFPQEGLTNDPGCEELLEAACAEGADAIGGCPYTDSDPHGQIARVFALARRFDLDVDLHLDFDTDPSWMHLDEVCRQTAAHGWGGRVAVGHVTKLSAVPPARLAAVARRLADCGVAVTALPATDLFLMGRGHDHAVPRGVTPVHRLAAAGVTCSLATNNVLNPFTPFGDASLVRMANLYANVAQVGRPDDLAACYALVTRDAARLMNLADYGIAPGAPADVVVLDAPDPAAAVATLAQPLFGLKAGRRSFTRARPVLHHPAGA